MNEEIVRLEDIVDILNKRWKMILSITVITTLIAGILSFFIIAPKYEASTKLFIGKENSQTQDKNYNNSDIQMYQQLLKTYAGVITTNDLVENAINNADLNVTSQEVLKNLTVTPSANTQILEIKYISKDKTLSRDLVDSITNQFIKESTELIPNGNVKVIESVKMPENPVSPNKKLNIAIGFLLGLMVSIGLAFLLEFVDNTFKTKEQVEQILGLPVVGAIPDDFN
ncbi:YveK family protein [Clostridium saccharobutylicum]|uniref:Capsular polysaccharide biosynthesis protein YwqC n=1 Tax=Clostridium saccharobutylicum DSM 13864 TaxID=1345695 RepID=U5N088_CLOSA|nr:Wzz/FepE/Etk N-terminal domain-containing protein [Clostridium saccharobutylicum]AGX45202.1 capsular polysaccharide biosynthesis protein YwqC [Clostridium saccharobutylicum DSM 13864]AQR92479.1 capsular polysaccharide type 8 biosynthesis protein cap8A [Clostridium saccharobutylicum]AQS02382.1 capsular polysaccharide type 8 biosynthesis protein cap8A [Clostridium saccharobutylicum]AQS11987.1 capsular polysaccharide type 8 biosynthesis protein cap8A [Clostridium saccharobutylicum]AQS16365.1 c